MGEERDGPVTPKKKYTPEFKPRVVREALEVGIYKEVVKAGVNLALPHFRCCRDVVG